MAPCETPNATDPERSPASCASSSSALRSVDWTVRTRATNAAPARVGRTPWWLRSRRGVRRGAEKPLHRQDRHGDDRCQLARGLFAVVAYPAKYGNSGVTPAVDLWAGGPLHFARAFQQYRTKADDRLRAIWGETLTVCSWSILLKNSISVTDEKMRALLGRAAHFELRGYTEQLLSRRRAS
jgi:hypothetical protein